MTGGFPSILSRGCTIIYFTDPPWLDVAVVSVSFCYRLHSETFSYRNLRGHPSTRLDQCGNASAAHSRGTERRPSLPCRLRGCDHVPGPQWASPPSTPVNCPVTSATVIYVPVLSEPRGAEFFQMIFLLKAFFFFWPRDQFSFS